MSSRKIHMITIVMLSLLILMCSMSGGGEAAPAPLFGAALLGSALNSNNGTSLLGLLLQTHLQQKIDALSEFAQLFSLTGNGTQSFILK